MSEIAQAYAWVYSTMSADTALMAAATGGIYQGMADIGTQPPFVIYARQSDIDVSTSAAVRLWSSILLQIKAVGLAANWAAMVIIANRIDALFKNVRSTGLPQGGVIACYREQQIALDDPPIAGAQWTNLGGLYRIALQGQ
jgi:hypothetical protein